MRLKYKIEHFSQKQLPKTEKNKVKNKKRKKKLNQWSTYFPNSNFLLKIILAKYWPRKCQSKCPLLSPRNQHKELKTFPMDFSSTRYLKKKKKKKKKKKSSKIDGELLNTTYTKKKNNIKYHYPSLYRLPFYIVIMTTKQLFTWATDNARLSNEHAAHRRPKRIYSSIQFDKNIILHNPLFCYIYIYIYSSINIAIYVTTKMKE